MCDTIVILGNSTEDGSTIFAKNSDREPNESQGIMYIPRKEHDESERVKCTYIDIPQVKETYEVLLAVPYWMWGGEMGANEFGLCIGNEAVFSKLHYQENGLLGMDLLRLTLERSKNANEALEIITSLLEKYGQGGSASQNDPSYIYHNSFIIADKKEAWVLETADKIWVAEKIKDIRTISNGYTIEKWDKSSTDIVEFAIKRGLCDSKEDFNFIECFSDPVPREATNCVERQKHTSEYLLDNKGKINISMVMKLLRSHDSIDITDFNPARAGMTICMHYSVKALSQTVNSMVSHLSDIDTHWFTGTSAPCISLFKPIFLKEIGLPSNYKFPGETYDPNSLWWEHEKLHRLVLHDYQNRTPIVRDRYNLEEENLITELTSIINDSKDETELNKNLKDFSQSSFENQYQMLSDLVDLIKNKPIASKKSKIYLKKWRKLSENVNLT